MADGDIKNMAKKGTRIEQYRISEAALFLPKKEYIPLCAIEKIQIRNSQMNTTNCCGMSFPVYNLIVFYGGEKPAKVMFEKKANAQKMAEIILASGENVRWEEYIPPYKKADAAAEGL